MTDWIRQLKPAATSPSTKLIPEVSPISAAMPTLTKILRRPDSPAAAEPTETKVVKATQARPAARSRTPRSAIGRVVKPKSELPASGLPAPAMPQDAAAKPVDAEVKPAVSEPVVAKTLDKTLDMTPADPAPVLKPATAVPAQVPPAPPRRRVIDVAAVIDRALHAAGLK